MNVESARIRRRIAGRKMAADMLDLLTPEDSGDVDFCASMLEALQAAFSPSDGQRPLEPAPEPIGRLGNTEIPFGQYKGKTLDDAPVDYLDWLCREQESFYKSLRAYLKHPDLESRRRGLG